jgi:2-dehydro-3-deoxyphosphogluconate aldolase/(4S)-4-hydroxy-2-oxoglutarate aldolase
MLAYELGVTEVKFFPAENYGGLKTLQALAAPFPQVKFVPTGGISADNIGAYLACRNVLACGGSWMVKAATIAAGDFAAITELTKGAVEKIPPSSK